VTGTILGVLGVLLALGAGAWAVVKYLRRAEANSAALGERTAELDSERERVAQQEKAALDAMRVRRKRLDEKAARVSGADDAARLLRDVTGADDPTVN
jgi:hypothetical protein